MEQNMWGFAIIEVKGHQIHGYSSSYMSNPDCKTQFHLDLSDIDACWILDNRHHLARTRWRDFLWFFRMFVFWTCLKVDSFFLSSSWDCHPFLAWLTESFSYLSAIGLLEYDETTHERWQKYGTKSKWLELAWTSSESQVKIHNFLTLSQRHP